MQLAEILLVAFGRGLDAFIATVPVRRADLGKSQCVRQSAKEEKVTYLTVFVGELEGIDQAEGFVH